MRKPTLYHHTGLWTYCSGRPVRNTNPVATLTANPTSANGINARAASTETRRKNPIRRRSKKPVMPTSTLSPMKCSDSQRGQTHVLLLIQSAAGVARSHCAKGSRSGMAYR